MAISCIVSQIKRDIDQKSRFFTPPLLHNKALEKKVCKYFLAVFFHNGARSLGYEVVE